MREFFRYAVDGRPHFLNVAQIVAIRPQPDGSAQIDLPDKADAVFDPETWADFQKRFGLSKEG